MVQVQALVMIPAGAMDGFPETGGISLLAFPFVVFVSIDTVACLVQLCLQDTPLLSGIMAIRGKFFLDSGNPPLLARQFPGFLSGKLTAVDSVLDAPQMASLTLVEIALEPAVEFPASLVPNDLLVTIASGVTILIMKMTGKGWQRRGHCGCGNKGQHKLFHVHDLSSHLSVGFSPIPSTEYKAVDEWKLNGSSPPLSHE
jgi:hypothetical protein